MRAIETTAVVGDDGTVTVRVPPDIPPGPHRIVLVIEEQTAADRQPLLADWPAHDVGPWPPGLSLRREDMYDEWGR